jgi:hypothetical protein
MEEEGENGIIFSHIPPNALYADSCLSDWTIRFRALMDRFQHVIRFSMFGHTHKENIGTIRSFNHDKPIGI